MLSSSSDADARRNHAEGRGKALALEVRVDPEARQAGNRVRKVEAALRLEVLLLLGRDDPVDQRARLLGGELLEVEQALEAAVDANDRRRACGHVEVRRVALDHHGQQLVDRLGCGGHLGSRAGKIVRAPWSGGLPVRHLMDESLEPFGSSSRSWWPARTPAGHLKLGRAVHALTLTPYLCSRWCPCTRPRPGRDRPALAADGSPYRQ